MKFSATWEELERGTRFVLAFTRLSLHTANVPRRAGFAAPPPALPLFFRFPFKNLQFPFTNFGSRRPAGNLLSSSYRGGATQRIEIPDSRVDGKVFYSDFSGHFSARLAAPDNTELRFVAEI